LAGYAKRRFQRGRAIGAEGREGIHDFYVPMDARITELTEEAWQQYVLGPEWAHARPARLDFSGEQYTLETLGQPRTEDSPADGFLNPKMSRCRMFLRYLNLDQNRLCDIDLLHEKNGFARLQVIKCRFNLVVTCDLVLSSLLELNLAYNQISIFPKLGGLPQLEVLILSNNLLTETWERIKEAKRLKRIDLSFNQIDALPSRLQAGILALSSMGQVADFKVGGNPFCEYFKEYQVFCVKAIKTLEKLDGMPVSSEMRQELAKVNLYTMERYDTIIQDRKAQLDSADVPEQATDFESPDILKMIDALDLAIADASRAVERLKTVVVTFEKVVSNPDLFLRFVFQSAKAAEGDAKDGGEELKSCILTFREACRMLFERHDACREGVVAVLSYGTMVAEGRLGHYCAELLMDIAQPEGSEAYHMVTHALTRNVIPVLINLDLNADPLDPRAGVLLSSLTQFPPRMTDELLLDFHDNTGATGLQRVGSKCSWRFREEPLDAVNTGLMARLCVLDEFCLEVMKVEGIVDRILAAIDNRALIDDMSKRGLWLDIITIASCMSVCSPDAMKSFQEVSLHVKLISLLKTFRSSGKMPSMKEEVARCRTMAALFVLIGNLMKGSDATLKECVRSYHVMEEFYAVTRLHPDPLLLTRALDGILIVLSKDDMRKTVLDDVVEALGKVTPQLQFLGGRKYREAFVAAELYIAPDPDKVNMKQVAPMLDVLHNEYVHNLFVAICRVVEFFTVMASKDSTCDVVNTHLNQAGREQELLKLLVVPSDDVKFAVMRTISAVQLDQLDAEELEFLIKILADTRNIAAGRTEEILAKIIQLLQKVCEATEGDSAETGQTFRTKHASLATAQVFEILVRNSQRDTYGNEEEEDEKMTLSQSCLAFLMAVSSFHELRDCMRDQEKARSCATVLKCEEMLHRPTVQDVTIEQTWTGRSWKVLMNCLRSADRLDSRKKVAFRALVRIADVLEGRTDSVHKKVGSGVTRLASREKQMWDEAAIRHQLLFLDDGEWDDRTEQVQSFCVDGPVDLLNYLLNSDTKEVEKKYAELADPAITFYSETRNSCIQVVEQAQKEFFDDFDKSSIGSVDIDSADDDEYASKRGRDIMMEKLSQVPREAAVTDGESFLHAPEKFVDTRSPDFEYFFLPGGLGHISRSFIVAPSLRALNAVLEVAPSRTSRDQVIARFRDLRLVHKLLSLLHSTDFLGCHNAAKTLRLLSIVFDLVETPVDESAPEMGHYSLALPSTRLACLDCLMRFVSLLVQPLLTALKNTHQTPLSRHELTLGSEICRLAFKVSQSIPTVMFFRPGETIQLMKKQDLALALQEDPEGDVFEKVHRDVWADWKHRVNPWCWERVYHRFFHSDMAVALVGLLIFDLSLDAGGSTGNAIDANFASLRSAKVGIGQFATDVLCAMLVQNPGMKYEILEAFAMAETFFQRSVRPSFLHELLSRMNLGLYEKAIGGLLTAHEEGRGVRNPNVVCRRVVSAVVQDPGLPGGATPDCTVVVTQMSHGPVASGQFWLLSQGFTGLPLVSHKTACAVCARHEFCPAPPEVNVRRDLSELKAVYRGFGEQYLIALWKNNSWTTIICEKTHDRGFLLGAMELLSAKTMNTRARIFDDVAFQKAVLAKVGREEVLLCACFATLDGGPFWGKAPRFFVLTDKSYFEMEVNWGKWRPQGEDSDDITFMTLAPPLFQDEGEDAFNVAPDLLEEIQQAHVAREKRTAMGRKLQDNGADSSDEEDIAEMIELEDQEKPHVVLAIEGPGTDVDSLLSVHRKLDIGDLEDVCFEPTSHPRLTLNLGAVITIEFWDDSARESWRWGLAHALTKSGKTFQREWRTQVKPDEDEDSD